MRHEEYMRQAMKADEAGAPFKVKDELGGIPSMVDNPPHYNNGSIECIEAIEAMLNKDEYIGYLRGNALKYRWRFRYKKKPFEDLRKARWYEERLMKFLLDNQDAV